MFHYSRKAEQIIYQIFNSMSTATDCLSRMYSLLQENEKFLTYSHNTTNQTNLFILQFICLFSVLEDQFCQSHSQLRYELEIID